ncbi:MULTISPECIES: DUF427 domain-containing protein [Paenibacillus]|uniref:DUF427 domain-containing protein n=1 Tax=Paenibacillus TaxID=44249 RepID=UPI00119CE66B|nr:MULTISPECIES: DUF427 domain-containing protein [Paenibacillus]MBJ9989273.1 DUF427 domain-containing protein [Paenibacillus sp. S28]
MGTVKNIKIDVNPRRVHVKFGGETIADSKRVLTLHERGHLPVYYFPLEDVRTDLLVPTEHSTYCPLKGEASYWTIQVNGRISENAVWGYPNAIAPSEAIQGYVSFYWDKVDGWYEEEEEIFVHARDPYKRVDALQSSRHIRVQIDGVIVAESRRPVIVFETGVPVRYYLPQEDVRMDLLTQTELQTGCPYKGKASYWKANINGQFHDNIVWSYLNPIPEIPKIKGLLSFYNERVEIYIDGEREGEVSWYRSALDFFNESEVKPAHV